MAGEFDFIEWIRSQTLSSPMVRVGPGDDLAVMDWGKDLLVVGADQVLDGVHFDSKVHSPREIGRKAMNRNLSDCAAMACMPAAAVATVALPRGGGVEYAKELYLGLREAADPFSCPIVGGDTASWEGKLAVSVTILAHCFREPVTRGGAKAGDAIYVTGPLGGSFLGRHMSFVPRVVLAQQLVQACEVSSMIDLSDGLSRDLKQICDQSRVGAVLHADAIPIHDDAQRMFRLDRRSPLDHALHDGEDYELLFTSPEFESAVARRIGTIVEEPGMWLESMKAREPLEPRAWEHGL